MSDRLSSNRDPLLVRSTPSADLSLDDHDDEELAVGEVRVSNWAPRSAPIGGIPYTMVVDSK
jgi:hypothetical protein